MEIRLRREDIMRGTPCSYQQCPIARAIGRVETQGHPVVDTDDITITDDFGLVHRAYKPHDRIKRFITMFDKLNRVPKGARRAYREMLADRFTGKRFVLSQVY